jgi:hypothetical protein
MDVSPWMASLRKAPVVGGRGQTMMFNCEMVSRTFFHLEADSDFFGYQVA